jgi:hypothetical protein
VHDGLALLDWPELLLLLLVVVVLASSPPLTS